MVDDEQIRSLDDRAGQSQFLPLRRRQATTADASLEVETEIHNLAPEVELLDHAPDQRADFSLRLLPAVDQFPEQDVVLHRGSRVVGLRIEEGDGVSQLRRQAFGEGVPRPQEALLDALAKETEAVARRDELERQR